MQTLKNLNFKTSKSDVLNKNEKAIIKVLQKNPKLKQKELAKELDISISTVQREMRWLSNNGYIIRVGSKRDGYWKIEKQV